METEPGVPLLRGWLIFVAVFIVLQPILMFSLIVVGIFGFEENPGYIELLRQAEGQQQNDLAIAIGFDMLSVVLPFFLWMFLARKFFRRKSGFAASFLKTILMAWAIAVGIDVLRAFVLGVNPSLGGYSGFVFGLGMAQWLFHSPRVKAVFIR